MKAKLAGFIHPGQVPWLYADRDTSIPAQYARAIADYQNDRVEPALSKADRLIAREPENPYFIELKAQMLMDFGRVKDAAETYRKALTYLPDAPLIRIALAHALIESSPGNDSKTLNEAIRQLERALVREPRTPRIHRLLATAYGRLGEENRAKLHLAEEAVLQRQYAYAREHINAILATEKEGSPTWIKARDLLVFIGDPGEDAKDNADAAGNNKAPG